MAIIGKINSIQSLIKVDKVHLDVILQYIEGSICNSSEINKRILNLPIGSFNRVELSDDIFAYEQVFLTKNREECFFESHKKYIDLQLIVEGEELMEYSEIEKLNMSIQYNSETDFIIYDTPQIGATSKILLVNNDMAIYFSHDGHMGLSKANKISIVHKTVLKVPQVLWNI